MSMDKLFFSYLAGFIDADGSIGIVTIAKSKKYVVQVAACNCNKEPIEMLKDRFGGKVRLRTWKNKKWRPNYEWKLTARKARTVIETILPYLRVKKPQAMLALEAQRLKESESRTYWRWHPEEKALRDAKLVEIKNKCLALNKRGVDVNTSDR